MQNFIMTHFLSFKSSTCHKMLLIGCCVYSMKPWGLLFYGGGGMLTNTIKMDITVQDMWTLKLGIILVAVCWLTLSKINGFNSAHEYFSSPKIIVVWNFNILFGHYGHCLNQLLRDGSYFSWLDHMEDWSNPFTSIWNGADDLQITFNHIICFWHALIFH